MSLKEPESNIFEKVKEIVIEQLGVNGKQVHLNSNFLDDLGADSLDTVELVMAIEEKFHIVIPDEDAEKIATINEAVKFIEQTIKNN